MITKKQIEERYQKIERKLKRVMKGCGGGCEKGGTCYHLSRDEKLVFNESLTDSKLERVRMYCDNCRIEISQLRAKLELLKELEDKTPKQKEAKNKNDI